MNIAVIVSEIDAEIEKLHRIRGIIQGLSAPVHRLRPKRKRMSRQPMEVGLSEPQIKALPQIVVLPPKEKREYRPRTKPAPEIPKALARAPSTLPVFVPRTAVPNAKPVLMTTRLSEGALEAVVRRNLMDRVEYRQKL
jgi:hypothetical protein